MIAEILPADWKKPGVWCDSDTREEDGFWVASLQMANQIGLDAGLMSGAACGSMLAIACHDSYPEIGRHLIHTHTHTLLGIRVVVWWFDLLVTRRYGSCHVISISWLTTCLSKCLFITIALNICLCKIITPLIICYFGIFSTRISDI